MSNKKSKMIDKKSNNNALQDSIMLQIEKGEISMRPKWHFAALSGMLIATTIVLALLFAVAVLAILDDLQVARDWQLIRGRGASVAQFPWLLLVLAILFVGGLYWSVQQFSFSYHLKRRLFFGIFSAGLVLSVIAVAFLPGLRAFRGSQPVRSLSGFERYIDKNRKIATFSSFDSTSLQLEIEGEGVVSYPVSERFRSRVPLEEIQVGEELHVLIDAGEVVGIRPAPNVKGVTTQTPRR